MCREPISSQSQGVLISWFWVRAVILDYIWSSNKMNCVCAKYVFHTWKSERALSSVVWLITFAGTSGR